jgi:glycosyltransferase involved in cell wall biosynthesis
MWTACRLARIPYAIYIREYITIPLRPIYRKILDRANRIFAVSRDVRNYVSDVTDPNKILVAYNHINAQLILQRVNFHKASGGRQLPFREKHPIVGIVGRVTPYKQQDLFVHAITDVLSEVPQARFVVVGSASRKDQAFEEEVKKLAYELGVQDKIAFMGYRKDALEIISELTVSCVPSTREPLGRVILESQLIGCPVVASNTGGSTEVIEDGVTGLLFPIDGLHADNKMASAVVRLLKDGELRNTIAVNARDFVGKKFTSMQHVKQLENYIESLVAKNGETEYE